MIKEIYTSGDYLQRNPTWHVEESPWKAKYVLRMLAKHGITPRTICEVGCGAGEILKLVQERMPEDCQLWGYEISPQAFAMCQARANERLHFKLGDIQQEPDAHFDLLLVMDVLEHMEDYFSFLRALRPKARYKLFHFPLDVSVRSVLRGYLPGYRAAFGHIHYFTTELAVQTLRDCGYQVLDRMYTTESTRVPWSTLARDPRRLPRKALGQAARALTNLPANLAFAVHQDFAERLFGEWRLLILAQ